MFDKMRVRLLLCWKSCPSIQVTWSPRREVSILSWYRGEDEHLTQKKTAGNTWQQSRMRVRARMPSGKGSPSDIRRLPGWCQSSFSPKIVAGDSFVHSRTIYLVKACYEDSIMQALYVIKWRGRYVLCSWEAYTIVEETKQTSLKN